MVIRGEEGILLSTKPVIYMLLFMLLGLSPVVVIRYMKDQPEPVRTLPVILVSQTEQKVYRLDLEDYLEGVLAAEMPARFELEALKAQAVAARTLAIGRMKRFGGRGTRYHQIADFSDDPNESQAWLSPKQLKSKWSYWEYGSFQRKIRRAVAETRGIVMVYNGKPIDAVFHSTCGVGTESAVNVWKHDIPYLQRVSCGVDSHSPRYQQQLFFGWNDVAKRLQLSANGIRDLKISEMTRSGRVIRLTCGSRQIDGREFRKAFQLNSNAFQIEKTSSGLRVKVTGYGHGVGMCQYGADGLAKRGWKFQQILSHYYQGIGFSKIKY